MTQNKTQKNKIDWVFVTHGNVMLCKRCGMREPMPARFIEIKDFLGRMKTFANMHSGCRE